MTAVDTSVWIAFLRGQEPVASSLAAMLDNDEAALPLPVRLELLSGVRKGESVRLGKLLSAVPTLCPSEDIWRLLESWVRVANERGQRFGLGDLLIAATAAEADTPLWSLDSDFVRMQKLGFVGLHKL